MNFFHPAKSKICYTENESDSDNMEKWITTSDNVKLFYEIQGTGPALVFLHGNSQTGRVFKKQVAYFSHNYRCLTIDTRAHGKSFFHGDQMTFARLAQDVFEILDAEQIDSAYLLGFSDGANIAMVLASTQPQRFKKLILNAGNRTHEGLYALMRLFSFAASKFSDLFHLKNPTLHLLLEDTGLELRDLAHITAKTFVLNGQFDVVKSAHAREIASAIPHAQLIIAPFATHLFFYFQPRRFNRLIQAFLA